MLAEVSRSKEVHSNPDTKAVDDCFNKLNAADDSKKYSGRFSIIHPFLSEKESLGKFKKERCMNGTPTTLPNCLECISVLDAKCMLENFISAFAGDNSFAIALCSKKMRVNEKLFHLMESHLKKTLSESSLIQLLKKLFIDTPNFYNLASISNFMEVLTPQKQSNFNIQFFKTTFFPILYDIVNQNAASNALTNEEMLNNHLACRRHPRIRKMSKLNNSISHSSFVVRPVVPALESINGECKINSQLNLLCIFTNNTDFEGISSDSNKSWINEDIKMILPITWNIVVAHNVITISDENNQNIRIFFRNPLKAKVDYRNLNLLKLSSSTTETISTLENNICTVQSAQTEIRNSTGNKTKTVNKNCRTINTIKNKTVRDLSKKSNLIKKEKYYLHLEKPILLSYTEEKKSKQMLMYKTHSLQSVSEAENIKNSYKILEELLTKSVKYEGDPVNLVFEPLKLIARLKQEEKCSNNLIRLHSSQGKHDLMENSTFKKFMKHKTNQSLNKTLKQNKTLMTMISKVECYSQEKNKHRNKLSSKSVIQSSTRLETSNLLKNLSTSVMTKNHEINEVLRENKPALKIRRRKKSRTALKRVNVKKIVSSVFQHFFHFYSVLGGHLKSGAVITRCNSNYWLKVSGIATDSCTLRLAGDLFTAVAGTKVVLNIFDYLQFLIVFARSRRIIVAELVKQMMESSLPLLRKHNYKKLITEKNSEDKSTIMYNEKHHLVISQSMPDLRI